MTLSHKNTSGALYKLCLIFTCQCRGSTSCQSSKNALNRSFFRSPEDTIQQCSNGCQTCAAVSRNCSSPGIIRCFAVYVRYNYNEGRDTSKPRVYLTCAEFHKQTRILVAGFDDGSFTVHEMPDFTLLQSFTSVNTV